MLENILCLWPNDHVRFEFGALLIEDDLTVRDGVTGAVVATLRVAEGHTVSPLHLAYHRERFNLTF